MRQRLSGGTRQARNDWYETWLPFTFVFTDKLASDPKPEKRPTASSILCDKLCVTEKEKEEKENKRLCNPIITPNSCNTVWCIQERNN